MKIKIDVECRSKSKLLRTALQVIVMSLFRDHFMLEKCRHTNFCSTKSSSRASEMMLVMRAKRTREAIRQTRAAVRMYFTTSVSFKCIDTVLLHDYRLLVLYLAFSAKTLSSFLVYYLINAQVDKKVCKYLPF